MPLSSHVPDLPALELLLDVAASGSIGAAARVHGITGPGVIAVVMGVGVAMIRGAFVAWLARDPVPRVFVAGHVTGAAAHHPHHCHPAGPPETHDQGDGRRPDAAGQARHGRRLRH